MSNGIIAGFFLVIVMACVAIGTLAAFSLHHEQGTITDNYGNTLSSTTNKSVAVGTAVSAPIINMEVFTAFIAVVLIIVIAVLSVYAATRGGGGSRPVR